MDDTDFEAAQAGPQGDTPTSEQKPTAETSVQVEANEAAAGLRGQIAALRQQVREAQDTLRDHKRREEGRGSKR